MKKNIIHLIVVAFVAIFLSESVFAQYTDFIDDKYIYARGEPILIEHGMKAVNKDLRGTHIHTLVKDADFSGSDLSGADLREADFENCSFRGANLSAIKAYDATFADCDFTGAVINGSTDIRISKEQLLSTASFQKKELSGIYLDCDDLLDIDFSGFDLRRSWGFFGKGCNYEDARVEGAHLPWNFSIEQLKSTWDFKNRVLIGVSLELDMTGLDLSGFNLTKCSFRAWPMTNFTDVDLTDAVITQCYFNDIRSLNLDQIKSTWNYKTGNMTGVRFAPWLQEQLDAERQTKEESP